VVSFCGAIWPMAKIRCFSALLYSAKVPRAGPGVGGGEPLLAQDWASVAAASMLLSRCQGDRDLRAVARQPTGARADESAFDDAIVSGVARILATH
jgi:hypothetical protein